MGGGFRIVLGGLGICCGILWDPLDEIGISRKLGFRAFQNAILGGFFRPVGVLKNPLYEIGVCGFQDH